MRWHVFSKVFYFIFLLFPIWFCCFNVFPVLTVLQAVKSETSGNFEHGLLTILRCSENPAKYFAKVSFHEPISWN